MLRPRDMMWWLLPFLVAGLLRLDRVPDAALVLSFLAMMNAVVCGLKLLGALVRLGEGR